jgi:hypothetical protein
MYGSHSEVLKKSGNIQLRRSVRHSHGFTSKGRGTIKTLVTYAVEYVDADVTENYSGSFGLTNKSVALKLFNKAVKTGGFGFLVLD